MTDYVIPCETFVRLSTVLKIVTPEMNIWFNAIRIDNGIALATNRRMMVMENIGGPSGVIHITASPILIAQCKIEAPFGSTLTITVNEALKYAVVKTTLGYVQPGNCCVWSSAPNDFDKWRTVVERCKKTAEKTKGAMFWDAADIANLATASPTGCIVFEETIDMTRPVIIRDITDPNWMGMFNPFDSEKKYGPATLPSWLS